MSAPAELSAITKAYDLVQWYVPIIGRFPRSHRFVLGERMETTLYGILEMLAEQGAWPLAEVEVQTGFAVAARLCILVRLMRLCSGTDVDLLGA